MVDNVLSEKERAEQDPIGYIQQVLYNVGAFVPEEEKEDNENELYTMLHNWGLNNEQILEVDEMIGNLILSHNQRGFRQGFSMATRIMVNILSQK